MPVAIDSQTSVSIQGLSKRFAGVSALQAIDLDVARSEFLSLLGPSGCGKTTLLRIIAGLESATSGRVFIGGVDATRLPPYERNIGLVFQNYALFPHKSVADNINFGLRYRTRLTSTQRRKAIDDALALVRLSDYGARRPGQLSGGQQQRVALARAIVTRPEVLLLDEPLSNLDAKLRDDMRFELTRLQRELGITFIYVTHDRIEALSMSDRIAVIQNGRVVQSGAPREIFERPNSASVADFIGHSNLLPGTVQSVESGNALVHTDAGAPIRGPAASGLAPGMRAHVLVPRNIIELSPFRSDAPLRGKVSNMGYQGLTVEIHVTLANGALLRVDLPAHRAAAISPGKEVTIELAPTATWAMPHLGE